MVVLGGKGRRSFSTASDTVGPDLKSSPQPRRSGAIHNAGRVAGAREAAADRWGDIIVTDRLKA